VTAGEFSFLGLGLVLGLLTGVALIELFRSRPPSAREVKLTVSHDAIPRRSSTLADDAFTAAGAEPARGGPADRRLIGIPIPAGVPERRTPVRNAPEGPGLRPTMADAIPVGSHRTVPVVGRIMTPALPLTHDRPSRISGPNGEVVGVTISSGDDPVMRALRDRADRLARLPAGPPAHAPEAASAAAPAASGSVLAPSKRATAATPGPKRVLARTSVALLDRPGEGRKPSTEAPAGPAGGATGRCAEERRIATERCELATLARARADVAGDAVRAAQRAYDQHEAAAIAAGRRADPRSVHDAKDAAQAGFRAAVAAATTSEALEAAARDWLTEINRINIEGRDATILKAREQTAAAEVGASLEGLALAADAARIAAENADNVCLAARIAVADCDERARTDPESFLVAPFPTPQSGMPGLEEDETLHLALQSGMAPRIFRLLRGDRQAMTSLVAALAGDEIESRRRWQLQLAALVEAIVADAIDAAALDFPAEHDLWGAFSREQSRDVVRALSSLGYRFDGLGGWTDGRHPSQRNLSLALGYAGLDPKRVRHWPTEDAIAALFTDVTVAADEYLASVAGDLTLAEMVTMLGRRADGLADIWNDWGRIRPLLLDEG
jgi:hypothetical protein